ncbi:hypothetical protein [Micromonospora sp. NPDC049891]|uniref:DUF6993 domain-containing protein n=1 Tax=Micromonospora sp. NPDC049891 TaxID=3155655 RepID=UPI0033CEEA01
MMRVGKTRWSVAAAALAALLLGCAAPGTGGDDVQAAPTSTSASPSAVAEPAAPQADAPPNHADNNGWKRRHELSAADQRTGQKLAARIRPKLEALRAAGDFAPASTQRVLLDLGITAEAVEVTAMRTPIHQDTPPPGAVYAVRFADVGCVIGDVRPDRVMVEVTGSAAEFGCLEPFSH